MNEKAVRKLESIHFATYAISVTSTPFSIALTQLALGATLLITLVIFAIDRSYFQRCFGSVSSSIKYAAGAAGMYVLWMIASALAGDTPVESILILKEEWLFLAVPMGLIHFRSPERRILLIKLFTISVLTIAVYGIVQHFTGIHWFKSSTPIAAPDTGYRVFGTFTHRLTFGNFFAVAAVFVLAFAVRKLEHQFAVKRILSAGSAIAALIATTFTYSRGALVGYVLGAFVVVALPSRRLLMSSVLVITLMAVLIVGLVPGIAQRFSSAFENDINREYSGSRLFIWDRTLDIIGDNPVFGVGQGNFKAAYVDRLPADIPQVHKHAHAHNDILNIAATGGIPAAMFFASLWVLVMYNLYAAWKSGTPEVRAFCLASLGGSVVFALTSLVEATFADEEVRELLMFIWAAGLWPQISAAKSHDLAPDRTPKLLDKSGGNSFLGALTLW